MAKLNCPVVVMTTKRQIRIFKTLVESAQSASFMVSGDGTHRNDCGNGKIVNLGVVSTVLDTVKKNRNVTRKCRNIIHVYMQTENGEAIKVGARWLRIILKEIFGMPEFVPISSCMDRSPAFVNAFDFIWADTLLTQCYVHILRRTQKKRLSNWDLVRRDLHFLIKYAITPAMMKLLLKLTTNAWDDVGEEKFATVFRQKHGSPPYSNFSIYACGVPGNLPLQQYIEGTHFGQKKLVSIAKLYAHMSRLLAVNMGKIALQCPDVDGLTSPFRVGLGECADDAKWLTEAAAYADSEMIEAGEREKSILGSHSNVRTVYLRRKKSPNKGTPGEFEEVIRKMKALLRGLETGLPRVRIQNNSPNKKNHAILLKLKEFLDSVAIVELWDVDEENGSGWINKSSLRVVCYCAAHWKSNRGCGCSFAVAGRLGMLPGGQSPRALMSEVICGRRRPGPPRKGLTGGLNGCYGGDVNEQQRRVNPRNKMLKLLMANQGTRLHGWKVVRRWALNTTREEFDVGRIIYRNPIRLQCGRGKSRNDQCTWAIQFQEVIEDEETVTWSADQVVDGLILAESFHCDGPWQRTVETPLPLDENNEASVRKFLSTKSAHGHNLAIMELASNIRKKSGLLSRLYDRVAFIDIDKTAEVLTWYPSTVTGMEIEKGGEDGAILYYVVFEAAGVHNGGEGRELKIIEENLHVGVAGWEYFKQALRSTGTFR